MRPPPPGLTVDDSSEFTDSDGDDDWQRPRGAASDSDLEQNESTPHTDPPTAATTVHAKATAVEVLIPEHRDFCALTP